MIKLRIMRWVGHVAHMGERRGVFRFLVGKPEGRGPLGRPRCRWKDGSSLSWMWGYGLDRAGLDRERWRAPVNAVMNLWVP